MNTFWNLIRNPCRPTLQAAFALRTKVGRYLAAQSKATSIKPTASGMAFMATSPAMKRLNTPWGQPYLGPVGRSILLMLLALNIQLRAQELVFDTLGQITSTSVNTVDVVGNKIYAAGGNLTILDGTNPLQPQVLSQINIATDTALDIQVIGNYAFIANDSAGLTVFDISNARNPARVVRVDTSKATTLQVVGNLVYLADTAGGLKIFDISNPLSPRQVGIYDIPNYNARSVSVSGSRAAVCYGGKGLRILNIANSSSPTLVGAYTATTKEILDVKLVPPYAYMAVDTVGLQILDVADPREMEIVGTGVAIDARRLALSGSYAYVADGVHGLRVFNISNPRQPKEAAVIPTGRAAIDVRVKGNLVYLCTGLGGLTILQQSTAPEITSHPQNLRVTSGTTATFSVTATGSPAPACHWQYSYDQGKTWWNFVEDAKVAGVATPTLTLHTVDQNWNQQWIRVEVTNKMGSVFSLPAILTVDPAPNLAHPKLDPPQMFAGFLIHGELGKVYQIQYSDLANPDLWQLAETITQEMNPQLWIDRSAPASALPRRFYRAVLQP